MGKGEEVCLQTRGDWSLLGSGCGWWMGRQLLDEETNRNRPICNRPDFVEGGGSYLGLCAGAYYGCSRVEFETGGAMEVVGARELAFFPGVARGAVVPGESFEFEWCAVGFTVDLTIVVDLT
jgi:glutamine amidotransferase-like uncharacterized protein